MIVTINFLIQFFHFLPLRHQKRNHFSFFIYSSSFQTSCYTKMQDWGDENIIKERAEKKEEEKATKLRHRSPSWGNGLIKIEWWGNCGLFLGWMVTVSRPENPWIGISSLTATGSDYIKCFTASFIKWTLTGMALICSWTASGLGKLVFPPSHPFYLL